MDAVSRCFLCHISFQDEMILFMAMKLNQRILCSFGRNFWRYSLADEGESTAFSSKTTKYSNKWLPTFLWYDTAHVENDALILLCRGNIFTVLIPRNSKRIHRQTYRHTDAAILLSLHAFVAAGKCLSSRFLAMKGGIQFAEPLPSNDRRDTHTDTQTDGKVLRSMPLRWAKVPWYTRIYQISYTWNYWVFGLCPSSRVLKDTKKHKVSGTGSVSVLRWGVRHLLCWVR
jgi:hypothetical protein